MKKIALILSFYLTACNFGAGTLGGFDSITFPTFKKNIVASIDSIYKMYPSYKIPDKWKYHDDWKRRGYDFLDSRIFYFKSEPEEMYYVTFLGDANDSVQTNQNNTSISIRAFLKYNLGDSFESWHTEDQCRSKEKKRIEKRFNEEIISKIEALTKTKAAHED